MVVPATISTDNSNEINAPKEVMKILNHSCYDCHSNSIVYPWYSHIAPLSWYIKDHVADGRVVVNFSIWKSYDKKKRLKVIENLPDSLHIRMPLPDYLWTHPEAKLSPNDKKILTKWAEKLVTSL
jgi:hypothetical protein